MNTKFVFLALSMSFITLASLNAQLGPKGRERVVERIKSQKVAFISEKLKLTEAEAQRFWPIYNDYQSQMMDLKDELQMRPDPNMTDAEAEKLMNNFLAMREKEIQLQRLYIQKFKTAISPKKIAMLYRAEKEFKEEMVSKIKERKQNRDR
ncbi:MAG: hypothetical protein R2774_01415 [Saprospiraceae bacterium]